MNENFVVKNVISIAEDYYQKNKSVYVLVKESGYLDSFKEITEDDILKALNKQPECVNEWLAWSDDQRISEGRYLQFEDKKYKVVEFSSKDGYKETGKEYPTANAACAAFIKYQIEFSRKLWLSENEKKRK